MRLAMALCSVLLLAGCASSNNADAPQTVGEVDLQRYQGVWYEQARLPMFFQRGCIRSEAHYRLQDDGKVEVINRCETETGERKEAIGEAVPQQAGRTDKLWVRFDNWFSNLFPGLSKGHYWVLYLDEAYSVALVGTPDRDNLWLLSREQQLDDATRKMLVEKAQALGYDTSELLWRVDEA